MAPEPVWDPPRRWGDTIHRSVLLIEGPAGRVAANNWKHPDYNLVKHKFWRCPEDTDDYDYEAYAMIAKHAQLALNFLLANPILLSAGHPIYHHLQFTPSLDVPDFEDKKTIVCDMLKSSRVLVDSYCTVVIAFCAQEQRDAYEFKLLIPNYPLLLEEYALNKPSVDKLLEERKEKMMSSHEYDVDEYKTPPRNGLQQSLNRIKLPKDQWVVDLNKHFTSESFLMASCTPILQPSTFLGVIFHGKTVVGFLPMWQLFPNCQGTYNTTTQNDFAKSQAHRPDITVGICEILKSYYNSTNLFDQDAEMACTKLQNAEGRNLSTTNLKLYYSQFFEMHPSYISPMQFADAARKYQPKQRVHPEDIPQYDEKAAKAQEEMNLSKMSPQEQRQIRKDNYISRKEQMRNMMKGNPAMRGLFPQGTWDPSDDEDQPWSEKTITAKEKKIQERMDKIQNFMSQTNVAELV